MREPEFWQAPPSRWGGITNLLSPVAFLYAQIVAWRFYTIKPKRLPLPLICVGNFTLGGAGKTPTALYLAQRLLALGAQPAILLRGYGSKRHNAAMRVTPHHRATEVGDEALMLAHYVPTYIGHDRQRTGTLAQQEGATVLIKDDGFQNPYLAHDYNLLVVDTAVGLGNGCVFPAGPLRETMSNAWPRVSAILLINSAPGQHPSLDLLACDRPCFHARLVSHTTPPENTFAFCAIAKPQKFIAPLEQAGTLSGKQIFDDHHFYSEREAQALLNAAQTANATLVTTAKDKARLSGMPPGSARYALAEAIQVIEVSLVVKEAKQLDQKLRNLICHTPA